MLHVNYVLLNFLLIKTKQKSSTIGVNIDDKCFLSSKSAYYNDFWRIMWHWRLELFSFASQEYILNYIKIEHFILFIVKINISQY